MRQDRTDIQRQSDLGLKSAVEQLAQRIQENMKDLYLGPVKVTVKPSTLAYVFGVGVGTVCGSVWRFFCRVIEDVKEGYRHGIER